MTNNEIIKALECCADEGFRCDECPYQSFKYSECYELIARNTLDLINRQKAEIERLQNDLSTWKDIAHRETSYVSIAKAEAIKEFAERLKETGARNNAGLIIFVESDIDNLVKEMVGEG